MQVRRAKLQPCGDNLSKKWQYFPGLPHFWGLLSLLFRLVPFFMLKTHVPVGIMEKFTIARYLLTSLLKAYEISPLLPEGLEHAVPG